MFGTAYRPKIYVKFYWLVVRRLKQEEKSFANDPIKHEGKL